MIFKPTYGLGFDKNGLAIFTNNDYTLTIAFKVDNEITNFMEKDHNFYIKSIKDDLKNNDYICKDGFIYRNQKKYDKWFLYLNHFFSYDKLIAGPTIWYPNFIQVSKIESVYKKIINRHEKIINKTQELLKEIIKTNIPFAHGQYKQNDKWLQFEIYKSDHYNRLGNKNNILTFSYIEMEHPPKKILNNELGNKLFFSYIYNKRFFYKIARYKEIFKLAINSHLPKEAQKGDIYIANINGNKYIFNNTSDYYDRPSFYFTNNYFNKITEVNF